mmetsp:Transcript_565/g.1159  ORF Transcript_565/g.1159 Transcript_565/m.1159 type:complete len:109 (-) Transcript_565:1332-1658(-)
MSDLEGQFTGVTQDKHGDLIFPRREGRRVELMEGGKDEDGCFSHSGFGLTDDVHSENGLGDTFMLHFGGVLETTVDDGAETFWFQNEVFETRGVDTNVVASVVSSKNK